MTTVDRSSAPPAGPPRPYHFPRIARATLDNGLRVLVAEHRNAEVASLRTLVRSGADHDSPEQAGLASLTADLLDEGAGARDSMRLAEDVGLLGATLGTGADWDASYVSLDVLSRNVRPTLEILADVSFRATFPADALQRVRSERLLEILQQRNEPGAIAGKRFASLLYGKGPYGNSVLGSTPSVTALAMEDVRAYYASHFVPNNSSLVISGDIDPAEAIELVRKAFGEWQPRDEVVRPAITPAAIEASRIYIVDRPQAVQSEIRIGHLGVPRSTSDYFSISVMNAILGGVFNSRININLRERHGYTYGSRSSFTFRRQPGPFVVSAPVRNEVTQPAVSEILVELRRIRTGDIEASELDDVKSYLMGVFPATVQTASDIASRLLEMELYGLPEDYFDRYRENIAAVTRDDIVRVANEYIDPERLLIVVVGSAAQIREPLAKLGLEMHELDVDGALVG